jgi:6-phosphogluconolactonase
MPLPPIRARLSGDKPSPGALVSVLDLSEAQPMPKLDFHCFTDVPALDLALAASVAASLAKRLRSAGQASLVVSGGRTPAGFLHALSTATLDWSRVLVTLADERCVDENSPHSNAASVRKNLLQGRAAQADFRPLYLPGESVDARKHRLETFPAKFDVVILGMGEDGHTASIFPDSPGREAALHDAGAQAVLRVEGKGPVTKRLTMTAPRLLATQELVIHITGHHKWQVLGQALASPSPLLPISHFLHAEGVEKHVFWSC